GQHMDHPPPAFTHLIGPKDRRTEETGSLALDRNDPDHPIRWELNQRRLLSTLLNGGLCLRGFEKALKKWIKERMEKERAEMANNERDSDMVEEEGDGPRLPRKSKF
ncbi:hypothetical protein M9458_032056, partial [Cirrhinus mrigala]